MRGLAGEILSLITVLAIPVGIAAVFPLEVAGFRARTPRPATPCAAFVTLSADEEAAAMRAAKTSWQGDVGSVPRIRADLFIGELPGGAERESLDVSARSRPPRAQDISWTPPPYLPSLAAPPPRPVPADAAPDETVQAFSRAELLSLEQTERKDDAK